MSVAPPPHLRTKRRRAVFTAIALVVIIGGGIAAFTAGNKVSCTRKFETPEVPVEIRIAPGASAAQRQTILRVAQRYGTHPHVTTAGSIEGVMLPHGVPQLRDRLRTVQGVSAMEVGSQVTVIRHRRCS